MHTSISTITSTLILASALAAQTPHTTLLFTPKKLEETASGTNGTILRILSERAIGMVTPGNQCRYSAEKYAPLVAQQTLLGDEDGDGDVHTRHVLGAVQAILVKPYIWDPRSRSARPRTGPINLREVYITPRTAPGTNVSGTPGLRPCDSGAIVANGQIEHFITGEQIIQALGMVDTKGNRLSPEAVSLDAITVDRSRRIFLSFEADHSLRLACGGSFASFVLQDGGIAMIPPQAWVPDANGNVGSVATSRGIIALTETRVDRIVANAKMTNVGNTCLTKGLDVDGLAIDRRGGGFTITFCGRTFSIPHLVFCTETMTGAGVASTVTGGQIAMGNGCRLASACGAGASDGSRMGLKVTGDVGSLDGLVTLAKEPTRFVLGTPDAACLDGNCEWHVATNLNAPGVLLFAGNGALPISPALSFTGTFGLPTTGFPEFFPNALSFGPVLVPTPPVAGWPGRAGTFGPLFLPSAIAPNGLISQAFTNVAGTWQLSTPMTFVK